MRKTIFALLALMLIGFALPAQADSLRVVTLFSPPLAFEHDGKVVGFAADIVREGLKRMGHEAHISIMPWKRAVFMARFGEADAIFYAVKNPEREQWFHYPDEPLVVEATVPLKRSGEPIEFTPDTYDYSQYRIGIGRGFYYGPKLKRFLDQAEFQKVEEATSIDSNFSKLIEGRIDIFLADLNLARHFMKKRASTGLVEIIMDSEGKPVILDSVNSFLAFSKETSTEDMANRFSEVLKSMKSDGTYDKILNLYQ